MQLCEITLEPRKISRTPVENGNSIEILHMIVVGGFLPSLSGL